jgi:hypothetical protein
MFVINDMELLMRLGRHKVLDYLLSQCTIAVSAVRLMDYSLIVRREIEQHTRVVTIHADDNFPTWFADKRKYLSISDLSSIYISLIYAGSSLVLSAEDVFLEAVAKLNEVSFLQFDDFIISTIKDERMIQLYNLIKVA